MYLHKDRSSMARKRNEVNSLKCTLMHKRIDVAEMELDDATGFIQKIGMVYAPEHLPVGIAVKKGVADRAALNEWWTDRSIPASRSGVREAVAQVPGGEGNWLISVGGKLLEQAPAASGAIPVTGLTALAPQPGQQLAVSQLSNSRTGKSKTITGGLKCQSPAEASPPRGPGGEKPHGRIPQNAEPQTNAKP